jgi:hypothetical protein
MNHGQLTMVADQFQWVSSEVLLNACGKDMKFCRRQHIITPLRLGLALTATCASQWVETIADFHGGFNALFGTTVTYKAFYNQVAKPRFADFSRLMTEWLVVGMMPKVLWFKKEYMFAAFRPIVIQDGSSFVIHDGLREVFPGRFKVVKPAAVELYTTMELLCDAPTTMVLPPDTTSTQTFLPEPPSLRARGLLADRGDVDLPSLRRVQDEGGFFLIRAKAGMSPQGLEAFREDGKRLRSLRNTPLQTLHAKLPKRQRVELLVRWDVEGAPLCLRLIVRWHRRTKSFCYFLTNLSSTPYPLEVIWRAYKWRWQVELLFKEGKSYANLPAFDTANPTLVEWLIWAAIAALKQFLAYMTQLLAKVPMAPRKVAMGAVHVVGGLVQALKTWDVAGLYDALEEAIPSLACQAQRAHPTRDRQTGRAQLGLEPCFEHDDMIGLADAA